MMLRGQLVTACNRWSCGKVLQSIKAQSLAQSLISWQIDWACPLIYYAVTGYIYLYT